MANKMRKELQSSLVLSTNCTAHCSECELEQTNPYKRFDIGIGMKWLPSHVGEEYLVRRRREVMSTGQPGRQLLGRERLRIINE